MKRSLRRLAVLGLLALGASSAGAQVLFNLQYNPSNYKLTITPTSASASGQNGSTTFLAEYGLLFGSFFPSNSSLAPNYQLPTQSVTGSIRATSHTGASMDSAWTDGVNPRDLNISTLSSGTMTFNSTSPAFLNAVSIPGTAPLVIEFPSSFSSNMPSASITGGAVVGISSAGSDVTLGTYNYSVVPEPSTYAAIAGALGLGYAIYRRRRQAAAAPATA